MEIKPKRNMCAVLEDMRKLDNTKNYALLSSLIEEMQIYANRMENGLWRNKDLIADIYNSSVKFKKFSNVTINLPIAEFIKSIQKKIMKRYDFELKDDGTIDYY